MQHRRVRLIKRLLEEFELNLAGFRVLTEAATGGFGATAVMAALAGAEVVAVARDSRHGTAADAIHETRKLGLDAGSTKDITFVPDRFAPEARGAHIITNSGPLRTINAQLIDHVGPQCVVPVMYEEWELRPSDIDVSACLDAGVPVAGTNEADPRVMTLDYLGPVAGRMLLRHEIEILGSNIVVAGAQEFGEKTARWLQGAGANITQIPTADGASLGDSEYHNAICNADAMVVSEHRTDRLLIGKGGDLEAKELASINPSLFVAHISGNVDAEAMRRHGLVVFPDFVAPPFHMSKTVAYAGPRAQIALLAAGLSVGQSLTEARLKRASAPPSDIVDEAARTNPLVQTQLSKPG